MSAGGEPIGADEDPAELAAHAAMMRDVAGALENFLNGGSRRRLNGFVLFTFPFAGKPGNRLNYISNADRAVMVAMVREWLDRAERGQ